MLDEDTATLEEDSGSGPERRDELEDFSEIELDEFFTSLRELEEFEAIHEELDNS
jgi:hypothetical protein